MCQADLRTLDLAVAGLWPIIPAGTAQVRPVNSLRAALETADELRS